MLEHVHYRDDLKRVAVSLHRVVGQLVAYCASAEDELNRTVLAQLLARLVPGEHEWDSYKTIYYFIDKLLTCLEC